MKFPVLCTAAALAVSSHLCPAGQTLRTPPGEDGSMVEVSSVFETIPPTGFAPVRVKLINNSAGVQNAVIRNTSSANNYYGRDHELESTFSLTAQPNKTAEREFMVPLCMDVNVSSYSNNGSLNIVLQAGNRTESVSISAGGCNGMPFTAFSEALAGKSITDINRIAASASTSRRGYGSSTFATLYSAPLLPSEWRGFSGLDGLAISSEEWTALQPGVKTAILQWVKLGGVLDMYSRNGAPRLAELGIRVATESGRRHEGGAYVLGNGVVCDIHWSGSELGGDIARTYATTLPAIRQVEYSTALAEREADIIDAKVKSYTANPLVKALGEKSFAAWQVGLILFVFGIVVGPVNLFYFARAGRRHRLFFTTPIISVAAAALLLLVIFFQDGIGGRGHRASVVYLDAAENTAFIHQFQVSRTGVLFGGSFTTEEPSTVNMAVLPDTRWTRLKSRESNSYDRRSRAESQRYSVSDKSYGGDWFQSRTEQAQIIDAVQSTRGRIDLKPGSTGAPVISSTLTASLERLFYLDSQGKYWASPAAVTTGASITLVPSSENEFLAWRKDAASMLPERLRTNAGKTSKEFFYAVSSDPGAGTVATLESIHWESDRVFLFGPLR